jgi:hypothetical protein
LINSRPVCFLRPLNKLRRDPFSRSYGVRLPSSLTAVLSSALGYSPRVPVSVLVRSTVSSPMNFSRVLIYRLRQQNGLDLAIPPRLAGGSASKDYIHGFNLYSRCGNINPLSIVYAFQPRLRYRLTLGGFTFPRKPYAFGVQDFHLHYRYSCRHSHLYTLHHFLRYGFDAEYNAHLPLQ